MPEQSPAVAFERVVKRYPGGVAVDDVSVAIPPGQFVALVGASGSGKSTLLKTVNRLVAPDAGRVLIDGADVSDGPAHLLRRRIGYVFQSIGLFPHMTVARNIAIGLRIACPTQSSRATVESWSPSASPSDPASRSEVEGEDLRVSGNFGHFRTRFRRSATDYGPRIDELLDLVDLPRDIAARMPDALSGGQRQRVGIARALAPAPRLMLMDEAFGALDPVTRDALGGRIRELHERLGLTTILVTHDMAEALLLADRVLVMKAGRIVADATPHELVTGQAGDEADALVAVPRAQAERLAALATA